MQNISLNLIQKIFALYNLEIKKVYKSQSGYRNTSYPILTSDNIMRNIIFFKNEAGILKKVKNSNKVSDYLWTLNFPTRKSCSNNQNSIIQLSSASKKIYACIYNYLKGETIPWESYTTKHIKLLGFVMGSMHKDLKDFPKENLSDAVKELLQQKDRIKKYFVNSDVSSAINEKLSLKLNIEWKVFDKTFETLKTKSKQTLHLDLVRGNVLFKKTSSLNNSKFVIEDLSVSGILDFEKTAFGPRILDIARTLAFLIIDCKYKEEKKVRKYFLFNGYKKRGKIDLPDLDLLEILLEYYWIYDFYKFLKHNPFESLQENEHFLRTRNVLLRRKLISVIE